MAPNNKGKIDPSFIDVFQQGRVTLVRRGNNNIQGKIHKNSR
jgi:hypothetical protein